MGIIEIIFGIIGCGMLLTSKDYLDVEVEKSRMGRTNFENFYNKKYDKICKDSNVLCISQCSEHVKISGIDTTFRLNTNVLKIANDVCIKYNYKIVNVEDSGIYYLQKI